MNFIAPLCPVAVLLILLNITSCQSSQFKPPEAPVPKLSPIKAASSKKELITEDWYKQQFEKAGLTKHWDFFKPLLRNEISASLRKAHEKDIAIGQSKMGGVPDLPKGVQWFKEKNGNSLSFIAQINLEEAAPFDQEKQLPAKGLLYFFYSATQETWGFDYKDRDKFIVFYFDGDPQQLERAVFPGDLDTMGIFRPCKLSFSSSYSLPGWEEEYVKKRLTDKESDQYMELIETGSETNKLFGYSDNIQAPMELECQLVTNGIYTGDASGFKDPRVKRLEKGAADWILLFQVESNDDAGMMWGDAGRLYFWIKKDDLKNKRFDKCWLILQCS